MCTAETDAGTLVNTLTDCKARSRQKQIRKSWQFCISCDLTITLRLNRC